jgi:hypothetical protein
LPNVPVRQIAPDMMHEYSGPTRAFCQEICSDGLECDGRGLRCEESRNICPYTTCPSREGRVRAVTANSTALRFAISLTFCVSCWLLYQIPIDGCSDLALGCSGEYYDCHALRFFSIAHY